MVGRSSCQRYVPTYKMKFCYRKALWRYVGRSKSCNFALRNYWLTPKTYTSVRYFLLIRWTSFTEYHLYKTDTFPKRRVSVLGCSVVYAHKVRMYVLFLLNIYFCDSFKRLFSACKFQNLGKVLGNQTMSNVRQTRTSDVNLNSGLGFF